MIEIIAISLENEMDLVLAHKRSMRVAEKVGLTIATQTTFATAVSEISRSVIEHTDHGNLILGIEQNKQRFSLMASISYDKHIRLGNNDEGYYYAQKLVPEFSESETDAFNVISMKIGVPRSLRLDPVKINAIKQYFLMEPPLNAYDEIKQRNHSLHKIAEEREEEIRRSKIIDEKKTEFISVASHEIKTPLTVLRAYTQIARTAKDKDGPFFETLLEKMDAQTTKLINLVQQLLDISKMENGNLVYAPEIVEINNFLEDVIVTMKHILPEHTLQVELCNPVLVRIDKIRMEQAVSNLIGNAAKYSEKQTLIQISSNINEEGMLQICITDQGLGMSKQSMESIFNKFYRDQDVINTHSGLGMGLYITSKIITEHGGKIWVESEEHKGSKFYITIPVSI